MTTTHTRIFINGWLRCASCDVTVDSDDDDESSDDLWLDHVRQAAEAQRAEAANSLRALIIETVKHRALTSWERVMYARSLLAAAVGRSVFLCDESEES